ncbi:hypothetical protein BDW71DRAFT_207289 [Aspergillus fruticulosus]
MRILLLSGLLAVYALVAFGYPTDADAITELTTPGYEEGKTSFEIVPYPGADTIRLSGTMQEVYAQILKINPNYEEDWNSVNHSSPNLEPRSQRPPLLNCHGNNGDADGKRIRAGIRYLRKFKLPPGLKGKTCKVVSCSWDSAIRWCNDRPTLRILPSFDNIADGAQLILDWCQRNWKDVGGVLDHYDDWRVFVDKGDC